MHVLDARTNSGAHEAEVARLREAYAALPPGAPVRLAKRTSNLFRFGDSDPNSPKSPAARTAQADRGLDVSAFSQVLCVDPATRTARVGGMTTYEDLCDATLPHQLMPLVVPQLKTITLGGAVTGLGIESTSLRNGLPHESVTEMEILTGDGRVVTAAPGGEHAGLYHGFPNSYGTLGYALSLTIELEPVQPYVHLRHYRFASPEECMEAVGRIAAERSLHGHRADFVDGTAFGLDEIYLTVGAYSDAAPWVSDYTGQRIYYRSLRGPREDFLTIRDYLWRWDTDWFWCSRPFGVQHPAIRRAWPLYPMQAGQVYVNFGFWGAVPLPPGCSDGHHNRRVEAEVAALGGRKSLYSTSFYSPEQFWKHYNGPAYAALKREYDGAGRLAGLYEKCVRGQ